MTTTTITGLPNASLPLTGTERVPLDQTIGTAIAATALVAGTGYRIETVGTTNWQACGVPAGVTAAVGLTFVATTAGTGTGTAIAIETRDASAADIAALASGTNLTYDAATRLLASSTGTDVTLPGFTSSLPGLVGASGGGTTNFLRADGAWAAPPAAAGTDLSYDPASRLLSSSTGADVTLPLAGADAGLISAADQAKLTSIVVDRARLTVADVRNNSGVSIPKGAPVYVTGSSGTTKTVALADASLEATAANTLGLAADTIANNSDGLVITEGPLTGLNTAGLTEGQLIWLSETTGAITSTRPTQPAHGVVLGWCVKTGAGSAGILYVKVDNGLELNELHDVLITSPATGQVLRRAADGLWKNAALVATDIGDSTATGRALLTAADAAAARSAISAEQTGAAASAQAAAVQRANHTGTQLAATISDFGSAVAALGTTVGNALRSLVNPSAVAFLRINADNSVTARSASEMRGDLGLGSAAQGTIGTAAGNVVALDGAGLIPSALLPGFVDDVLEYANIAAFPATGETGKLYVSLATNRVYRWSGSIYIEIAASPGTTDVVTEGSVNLYFTNARARAAISVAGSLSYNPATGVISYTAPTLAAVATSGAYSDLSGRFDPATPGAIGGTTPAAGTFTALSASASLLLPSGAPATPLARHVYAVADTLRYRDSSNVERLLLNAADNLSNVANAATALSNLGGLSATTTRAANLVLAGPTSGAAAAPTFRALVAADLPAVTYSQHSTLTASASTYTLDATAFNEFTASAAIAGNVTITCSNLSSVPSGQVWRAVFRFAYTSGAITFGAPAGVTAKADVPSLSSSRTYDVVVRYIGGGTTVGYQISRGEPT